MTTPDRVLTTVVFSGRVPSKKNSRRWIYRGGRKYLVPSLCHEAWEQSEIPSFHNAPKLFPPYSLSLNVFAPDFQNCDLTNLVESVNDLLVKTELLEDDNWFALNEVHLKFIRVDRENPRVEVTILSSPHPNSVSTLKTDLRNAILPRSKAKPRKAPTKNNSQKIANKTADKKSGKKFKKA